MKTNKARIAVIAGILAAPGMSYTGTNGTPTELPDGLLKCMDVLEHLSRLSCFDQEMGRLTSTTKQESPEAADDTTIAVASEPAAPATEASPGHGNDFEQQVPDSGSTPEPDDVTAMVVQVSERAYGEMIVSLDNGQVWVEKIPSTSFSVDVGDKVTIRRGRFGGYRLSGQGKRSVEVTRVQ